MEMMRAWRVVPMTSIAASESCFRVLQYNVLAETLAKSAEIEACIEEYTCLAHLMEPGSAGKHFYRTPNGSCHAFRTARKNLLWEHRFPLIVQEILSHEPDIICLQEVDRFDDFEFALKDAGYVGLFCKKAWKKVKDGSAIFWRSDKFSLQSSKVVQLKLDSPMKALLVRLVTPSGLQVIVCSTHLKCGMDMEAVRTEQIAKLDQSLQAFAEGTATVLCGDLNSHLAPIRLCTSECGCDAASMFEPQVIPALEASGFRNAYARFPSFTCWSGFLDRDVKATFDYILVKGPVATRSVLELPKEEYVAQFAERLPNETCPSDHFCLVADLEICADTHHHRNKLEQLGIRKVPQTITGQLAFEAMPAMENQSTLLGTSDSGSSLPELELFEPDLTSRFSDAPGSKMDFFVELRFIEPTLCQAIARVQSVLESVDQHIMVEQSCAADNLHATMNEVRLANITEAHHVASLCEEALKTRLAKSSELPPLHLQGLQILGGRTIYAEIIQNDARTRLHEAFDAIQQTLLDAGYKPRERDRFVPHVTVCKARGRGGIAEAILRTISEHGFDSMDFGSQPLFELCLCYKRRPDECMPPVLRRLKLT